MEGPVVNNAYNSQMRAIALDNHICVSEVSEQNKCIYVYRYKMYTISDNSNDIKNEDFYIKDNNSITLREMLEFISFHFQIALESHTLKPEEILNHKRAIEMIEVELNLRQELENEAYIFLLNKLIREKTNEIEHLKKLLIEIELGQTEP